MSSPPAPLRSSVHHTLRALDNHNLRLFFTGQSISLIGTWMQNVALSWLVYRITGSEFWLGFVTFCSQIPAFVFTPLAGALADRVNRHRVIVITQVLAMVQALTLAGFVLTGHAALWNLIPLALFVGVINAFDLPTRQSFYVDIIERREDLPNAIALNSMMFNGSRLIGPSLAGGLIAVWGEGICFLLNGVSYVAVLWSLLAMTPVLRRTTPSAGSFWHGMRQGFRYAAGTPAIRALLLLVALFSVAGMPYLVLMPVFAKELLGGGPKLFGLMMGSTGIGALAGGIFLASRRGVVGLDRAIARAGLLFGAGIVAFSFSRVAWLSHLLLAVTGFGMLIQFVATNTILQTIVADDKRGRVMSFYTLAFIGMVPLGSLLAGSVAHRVGAPHTLLIGGLVSILGAAVFYRHLPRLRMLVAD